MNTPINVFGGPYDFLSNFYPAPILWRGQVWPTAEHLYQAAKTLDLQQREVIRGAFWAGMAKKMGSPKGYKGFVISLRPDWEDIKLDVMSRIIEEKFGQNPELQDLLLATGLRELAEGNWWNDRFWGVDLKMDPPVGENWMGKLLMKTRTRLALDRIGGSSERNTVAGN